MTAWGSWSSAGGNAMRVGADWQFDGVDTNTVTFHAHIWFYVQNQYNYSGDAQALNYAGYIGGSDGYTLTAGHDAITLVAEKDVYWNYGSWGSSPGNIQISATVSGAYNGSTPTIFLDLPVPARPYANPNSPFALTSTRNSDTQATLNWFNDSNPQAPYTGLIIEISEYGNTGWTAGGNYWIVAQPGGTATSFTHYGLSPNHLYAFRIRSTNTVGSSNVVYFPWVYLTPAAPSNVASSLGGAGTTITTTWVSNHYSDGTQTLEIDRSVAGGAYASVVTGLAWNVTSWTDPTPGAGTNQYRVRAYGPQNGGMPSAWTVGNSVATVVAPLAPTLLHPDGTAADTQFVGAVLTWTHNPGGDQAAQTHFTIESSVNGGSTWQARATNIASAVSSWTLPAGVLNNGLTILWRVKTQGGVTAGFGPFSDPATITSEQTPTVTIDPVVTVDPTIALPMQVAWFYAQAQGIPQTLWVANLYAADGTTILEQQFGQDAGGGPVSFAYPIVDGVTYWVGVQAMSGSGMWSAWATFETTVDLPPPAPTALVATYQPCTGTMSLELTSAAPGAGESAVESLKVERRVMGGTWVMLTQGIDPTTTMLDLVPLTNGVNEYRVTSTSSVPSMLVNPVVTVSGTDGQHLGPGRDGLWVFVNYGPGFASVLRVHSDLSIQDSPARTQNGQPFLGRRKPTLLSGIGVSREVSVSGRLRFTDPCPTVDNCRYDSPPTDWITAGQDADIICYRDFTGRRIFASLDGVRITDEIWPGNASLGFKATEMDYIEPGGVLQEQVIDGNLLFCQDAPADIDGGGP